MAKSDQLSARLQVCKVGSACASRWILVSGAYWPRPLSKFSRFFAETFTFFFFIHTQHTMQPSQIEYSTDMRRLVGQSKDLSPQRIFSVISV